VASPHRGRWALRELGPEGHFGEMCGPLPRGSALALTLAGL
jgi:hypothetical protein